MSQNPYQSPGSVSFDTKQASQTFRNRRIFSLASIVVCGMPLVGYLYVWLFWVFASATLGEWARPGLHDPKMFLFGIPHVLSLILMMMAFAVAPLVFVLGYWRRKVLQHVLAYGFCLTISIVVARMDILQVTSWIAD